MLMKSRISSFRSASPFGSRSILVSTSTNGKLFRFAASKKRSINP